MGKTVSVDSLATALADALAEYNQDVTENIKKDVKAVAKEALNEIKENSPKRFGKYKKGWSETTAFENRHDIRILVHNKQHYRLTHLLEDGHAKRNGGRVAARPHIKPAEERAAEALLKKVKVHVKA